MTSKEFVIWLTGFVEAIDKEPTLTQLNTVKDKLTEVKDEDQIGVGGFGILNTINQPFISTPPNGTGSPNPPNGTGNPNPIPPTFTISTTPVSIISTVATSDGTTSTTYGYPLGSSWHYTDVFNKK
jgi:hypothetical protein